MNSKKYTILGFITIILWGTSPAFTKTLSSSLGAFTAAALVNIIGGTIAVSKQLLFENGFSKFKEVSKKYWFLCGSLFIIYTATSYISVSIINSEEVVTLVLIKFLWPLFTLILTIPILKQKASLWLIASVSLSLVGIVIAKVGTDINNLSSLFNIFNGEELAYILGLIVAISWALYTNYTKKIVKNDDIDGVGIFMLIAGVILGTISLTLDEPRAFSPKIAGELLYQAVVTSYVANILWNLSIKKGNLIVVLLVSNFLPIISTICTALILGVGITSQVLIGAVLVVAGTLWSKRCFQ